MIPGLIDVEMDELESFGLTAFGGIDSFPELKGNATHKLLVVELAMKER